jgi:hypothetical protein
VKVHWSSGMLGASPADSTRNRSPHAAREDPGSIDVSASAALKAAGDLPDGF